MTYYSRAIQMPKTKREGLANVVQGIINRLEAGEAHEALLQAVDLLDDVTSNANPYHIDGKPPRDRRPKSMREYRGNVNTD